MRNHIIWKYGKQLEKGKLESKNVLLKMPFTTARGSIHLVTMDFNPRALSKRKIEFQRNGTYRLVEKG